MSQTTTPAGRVHVFHRASPRQFWKFVGTAEELAGVNRIITASGLIGGTWWALTSEPYPGEERTPEMVEMIEGAVRGSG